MKTRKIIGVFFLLLISLNTFAATTVDNRDLDKYRKSLNKILPKKLRTWTSFYFWTEKNDRNFCVEYKEDPDDHDNSAGQKDKYIFVNPDCVTQKELHEIKSRKFSRNNILNSEFKKSLIRTVVDLELPFRLKRKRARRQMFLNNYFQTPWTIGVDIKSSLKDSNKNFYKEGVIHYLGNPNFSTESPAAFKHLKEKLFNNHTYFQVPTNLEQLAKNDTYSNSGKVKVLRDGNETFWARYHMIESAQKSIYLSYFALFHDVYGLATLGLILEKLKANPKLDVVILLDGKGTFKDHGSEHIKQLIKYGAKVKVYNPVFLNWAFPLRTLKVGFIDGIVSSNHDKILLVDDVYFTTGGRNIADKYFVSEGEIDTFIFHDTDVFIKFDKFPIAVIKAIFTEFDTFFARRIWRNEDKEAEVELQQALAAVRDRINNRELSQETLKRFPELERHKSLYGYKEWELELPEESYPVKGYDNTSKLINIDELTQQIYKMIDEAEHQIVMQNPYVVLTEDILERLERASKRGVEIVISTSSHVSTDSILTVNYLRDNWKKIMKRLPTLRIFGFLGPEKSHSKVFVFDDKYTVIGSYNLDILSESINSEFAVVVESKELATETLVSIQDVIYNSFEYSVEDNVGPHSIPGEKSRHIYKKNRRARWDILGWIARPWL